MLIQFTVPGQPHPAERPRRVQRGRGAVWITPDKTLAAERAVRDACLEQFAGMEPFAGEVVLTCTFYRHTRRRADVDNLTKTVMDGLNMAGIWADDSQVAVLSVRRIMGCPAEEARTVVTVSTIE